MPDSVPTPAYITEVIPVSSEWKNVISYFYYARNTGAESVSKILVPTFQTILLFSFGDTISARVGHEKVAEVPFVVGKSVVLGPIKKAITYTMAPGSEMLIANFRWDAFYRFFGKNVKGMAHYVSNPDELLNSHCFSALWQELKSLRSPREKVASILSFAAVYLQEREGASSRIVDTIQRDENTFLNPVKTISEESGQGERTIQLQFQKYLGFSSKEKVRFQRFQRAVHMIEKRSQERDGMDWQDIVEACGYYDQSHLVHDFTFYLDLSPSQFLKLQQDICIAGD